MTEIENGDRLPTRGVLLAFAAVVMVCLFGHLGAIGLAGPDEPRYAWIARAMAATGDWVTPRLYGQPWFEKPILYYWAAAAGFLLHLPAEWAARLPSAFAALAAALAIGWLGWKHYGGEGGFAQSPGLLAPLLFSSSVAAIGFARAATPDMLFSASIALAMAGAACVLRHAGGLRAAVTVSGASHGDSRSLLLFGASLGLGVLAKGPAAVILAGGAMGLWAVATKRWRAAFRVAHPLAIAAFAVVALPWYILCAHRNPDFLRIFIVQHNFERYLTPLFQHRQPFWFFGPITLLALLPWTVLLWPAAREGVRLWREKSWSDSPGFFFACWALFPVLFFSFSQSKLPGYILPAIPPLVLLCSIAASRAVTDSQFKTRAILAGVGLAWILVAIAAASAAPPIPIHIFGRLWSSLNVAAAASAALIAILLLAANYHRKPSLILLLCALFVAAGVEIASLKVLPLLDPVLSARPHAAFMRDDRHPDRIFTYHLRRTWNYGLAFYFRREIPEWSPADPEAALVLTTPDGLKEIERLGRFRGELDQARPGILYVPVNRTPR